MISMEFEGKLYQIGVVVRDLDAGMKHYQTLLGLGPFRRLDTHYTGRYRGTVQEIANRNAFARWGDLYLEMVEPGRGQSSASEWLAARGEGIFHIGYATTNLEQRPGGAQVCFETIDNLTESGQPAIVHLDTLAELGYFVELADADLAERLARWIDGDASLDE
jgi:4-hydroxyphenylpyruvate dioxygenase-like putative hemolysin